jgi:hypothetical protein
MQNKPTKVSACFLSYQQEQDEKHQREQELRRERDKLLFHREALLKAVKERETQRTAAKEELSMAGNSHVCISIY